MSLLTPAFFQRDVLVVAQELIGVELRWKGCSGIIVETEAYAAEGDPTCHTASRPSARLFMQNHEAGAAYVYFNYGMYWLFNLLVKGGSRDGLVLVRALEPKSGIELMQQRRGGREGRHLCSGPGKLALAMGITGEDHGTPMVGEKKPASIMLTLPIHDIAYQPISDVRVGISKAAEFPWRYLAKDNVHVSVSLGKVAKPKTRTSTEAVRSKKVLTKPSQIKNRRLGRANG